MTKDRHKKCRPNEVFGIGYFEHYREQLLILNTSLGLHFCDYFLSYALQIWRESSQNQCTVDDKQKYKNNDSTLYQWGE